MQQFWRWSTWRLCNCKLEYDQIWLKVDNGGLQIEGGVEAWESNCLLGGSVLDPSSVDPSCRCSAPREAANHPPDHPPAWKPKFSTTGSKSDKPPPRGVRITSGASCGLWVVGARILNVWYSIKNYSAKKNSDDKYILMKNILPRNILTINIPIEKYSDEKNSAKIDSTQKYSGQKLRLRVLHNLLCLQCSTGCFF